MTKVSLLIVAAIPPWLAVEFGAPEWGVALSLVPFFLLLWRMEDDEDQEEYSPRAEAVAGWLALIVGLTGIAIGLTAWALWNEPSLVSLYWVGIPFSVILTIIGVVRLLRK